MDLDKKAKRPTHRRSTKGCSTCRIRKIKCDEQRPTCKSCLKQRFTCDWPGLDGVPEAARNRHHEQQMHIGVHSKTLRRPGRPLTIRPALDLSAVPCANSILLSRYDQRLLYAFSDTNIYYTLCACPRSPLRHVSQHMAASSDMVMHMILAVSAVESHTRDGGLSSKGPYPPGLYHYTIAVQKLRRHVESADSYHPKGGGGGDYLMTILTTLFFMIQYGLEAEESMMHHVKAHAVGLTSVVESHLATRTDPLPPEASRLMIWVMSSLCGVSTMLTHHIGRFDRLVEMLLSILDPSAEEKKKEAGDDPQRRPSRGLLEPRPTTQPWEGLVHQSTESSFPTETMAAFALLDSVELIYLRMCGIIYFRHPKVEYEDLPAEERETLYYSFMRELIQLQRTHKGVFFSKAANISVLFESESARQIAVKAVVHYWTCILFCRRWLGDSGLDIPLKNRAAEAIVDCVRHSYATDKRSVVRFLRPCLWALMEGGCDPESEQWLSARLDEVTRGFSGSRWCYQTALNVREREKGLSNTPKYLHFDEIRSLPSNNSQPT